MKAHNILALHPSMPLLGHLGKVTRCLSPAGSFRCATHSKSMHFRCRGRDLVILQAAFLTRKLEQNNHTVFPKPSGWFYSDRNINTQI